MPGDVTNEEDPYTHDKPLKFLNATMLVMVRNSSQGCAKVGRRPRASKVCGIQRVKIHKLNF